MVAVTLQVAASHTPDRQMRLGRNLLGRTHAGEELESLWDRHEELPWRKAVRWAQSALQTVTPASRTPVETQVEGILRGLAGRLERGCRARSRRTRHAEQRHASGRRPTAKALDDARTVSEQALYVDERSGTMVVLGDRGRAHFFTPDGRLVSSVRYSREEIDRKLKTERWRPAPVALAHEFRGKLPQ